MSDPATAPALLAAANEALATLADENRALHADYAQLKRGAETLARILNRHYRDLVDITDSQDLIGEDGDGEWDVVWDRLVEIKRANADLNAELTSLRRACPECVVRAEEIAELTRQRDDARGIAVRCGAFDSGVGADFPAHLHAIQDESVRMALVDPDGKLFGGAA